MSRYSGRYHKGASKDVKAEKRAEAEGRNARHKPDDEPKRHLVINGASGGIPVPVTDAELAKHLATTPHSTA